MAVSALDTPPATSAASTGAELISEALAAQGLEYLFNLPGNGVYPMLDPLHEHGIRYILGLHEASLVSMADGYARATGRVPFVNVYMVPGTANALSAIYIASRDRVPLVVTSTQQSRPIVARDTYASHDDLLGLVRGVTKWSWEVNSVERLPEAIHRAFKIAATPPLGPVFLSLPVDLFPARLHGTLNEPSQPTAVPRLGPPPADVIEHVADLLVNTERVLIIAGKDVLQCDAVDDLVALAEDLGGAVANEPWNAVTAFPQPHSLGFGEYTRDTFDAISPTLVLGVGARMFTEAVSVPEPAFPPGVRVVTLGLDPMDLGRVQRSDVAAVCDVREALSALRAAIGGRIDASRRASRLSTIDAYQSQRRRENQQLLSEHFDDQPMSLARLTTELNRVITPDTVVVEHGTTSTGMLMTYLELPRPANVFGTGASVQGWGLPASIGIQLGRPQQRVLAIVGDGGFTFTCQGLWTAARYTIPVTVLVLNNHGYRSMRGGMQRGAPRSSAAGLDFGYDFRIGIGDVARGFGVPSLSITDPSDVAEVVGGALAADGPRVVEVAISPALTFKPSRTTPMAL
ncbi:MAG: thiamine pyrophosphate-binding protein [Chloroflexi bacterium]|nr:thiamine pyrophosphate-binding protein [Chloroflexota bacterium]